MENHQVVYGRLFHNRSFVALWLGQTVSFVGDYFQWLAIPILVERMTGSSLLVGLAVISNALPMLVLGPVAGVFVDQQRPQDVGHYHRPLAVPAVH
ncbi:MAG: MFS transporter, partial [Anaerolineae bacterium]